MRKLWLIFAQTVTISLAVLFALSYWHPTPQEGGGTVTVQEAQAPQRVAQVQSYSRAVKRAMPAVVSIYTSKETRAPRNPLLDDPLFRRFFGEQLDAMPQRVSSLGSGVIVSSQGYILTNHHVVESADEIEVALGDGRSASARIVGGDPDTDLAVLKIDLPNLPFATFGQSEKLEVGDVVLAIGNPFGVGQTVTMGIVSALGRSHLGINTFENFIQTDAAINPGNSGGGLIDEAGNVVGINSAIYSRSGGSLGIGFAIPVSIAKKVMEQIIQHGSVTRGWIGVEMQDITPELAQALNFPSAQGTLIGGVLRSGPADRAGMKPGDILLRVNGKAVNDSSALLNMISALAPGSTAEFAVRRNRSELELRIKIGKRPPPTARPSE
ncbi:MAG: Do family serine endopeptidase [Sulfuricellaceae bacterium]|nr:Do family serine endopeptidase [Sulfuricellaceae bacterium]